MIAFVHGESKRKKNKKIKNKIKKRLASLNSEKYFKTFEFVSSYSLSTFFANFLLVQVSHQTWQLQDALFVLVNISV